MNVRQTNSRWRPKTTYLPVSHKPIATLLKCWRIDTGTREAKQSFCGFIRLRIELFWRLTCLNHLHRSSCVSPLQSSFTFLACLRRAMTRAHKNADWGFKGLPCVSLLVYLRAFNQHREKPRRVSAFWQMGTFNAREMKWAIFLSISQWLSQNMNVKNRTQSYCTVRMGYLAYNVTPSIPFSKGCFPKAPSSPSVWAREIAYLLTGSSTGTHAPASQEALPVWPTGSFINLDTQTHTSAERNERDEQMKFCVAVRVAATSDRIWKGQGSAESWA